MNALHKQDMRRLRDISNVHNQNHIHGNNEQHPRTLAMKNRARNIQYTEHTTYKQSRKKKQTLHI